MTEKGINYCDEIFSSVLGYAVGNVAIYSNRNDLIPSQSFLSHESLNHYIGNVYMGIKWQSIEFVRRFLYVNYGMVFPEVTLAHEIFSLRILYDIEKRRILALQAFLNGGKQPPTFGSMLIWATKAKFEITGHVAIVTDVFENKIRIVEQNVDNNLLPKGQKWTRELRLSVNDGNFLVHDTFDDTIILGWMIQMQPNEYSLPRPMISGKCLGIQQRFIEDRGQFRDWLRASNYLEHAYLQVHHEQAANADNHEYFTITKDAEEELARATNEMHLMFMQATDVVLNDDKLMRLFYIPQILWEQIRISWQTRHLEMITGRFDFCMDERGLKVYEYNADSSSCHTESAIVIERWVSQSGIKTGHSPCKKLRKKITTAWKHSDANCFVYILKDNRVSEENYHALFMQDALKHAGFNSKIVNGLDEIHWNSQGNLVDDDGNEIQCVWKTWAWETALEELKKEVEIESPSICKEQSNSKVRLLDVLLHPKITVFEPLWTIIPSNKAILPILWRLFPDHPYLLYSDFKVNQSLEKGGYVAKPISGRCGSNIKIVDQKKRLLDESIGCFGKDTNIYQELWSLPKVAGRYLQMCTFTAAGKYSGACLRSDSSMVIKYDSLIQPLVILPE